MHRVKSGKLSFAGIGLTLVIVATLAGIVLIGCCIMLPPARPPDQLPPPNLKEVVETGMLSLVEAQHGFYTHVKLRERFAENMFEMGNREQGSVGMVLVMGVWNADYDGKKTPFHGYLFKVMAVENENPEDKKGFAVIATPANWEKGWPIFITHIKNASGGMFTMRAADTWLIEDPELIATMRKMLGKKYLTLVDLLPFSSEKGATETIKGFKL